MSKAELLDYHADLHAGIESLPWKIPAVAPAAPMNTGSTYETGRKDVTSSTAPFAWQDKRYNGPYLAIKCQRTGLNLPSMLIEDIDVDGGGILFRSHGSGAIDNAVFRRLRLDNAVYTPTFNMGGLLFSGTDMTNALIEDCHFDFAGAVCTDKDDIPAGIGFQGKGVADKGSNITIRNVIIKNLLASYPSYLNTDGMAFEAGYTDIDVQRSWIENVSDACWDIKGARIRLDDVHGKGGREIIKRWVDGRDGAVYTDSPSYCHFQLFGAEDFTTYVIDHLDCASLNPNTPIFRFEDDPVNVIVKSYDLSKLQAGQIIRSGNSLSTINWGVQGPPTF